MWTSREEPHRAGGFHIEHARLLAGEGLRVVQLSVVGVGVGAHAVDGVPCLAVARARLLHIVLAAARRDACMHSAHVGT